MAKHHQQAQAAPRPADPALPALHGSDSADKAEIEKVLTAIEQARGSKVIVYWTTALARISEATVVPLYDQLVAVGRQPNIDLVLFSFGGDTEAPWPIISLLREYCDTLGVLVPHRAQSSGTLVALGADEIVMTPLSVLGPIDPTRTHHLLPTRAGAAESEPISVQDMRHAMAFVRTAFGDNTVYTPEAMASVLTALFEKVHPLAIGAIEQSYALAKLIAKQCLGTHMGPNDEAKISAIADQLCDGYKSHAYEINRREAAAIGLKVVNADQALEGHLMACWRFYMSRPSLSGSTPPPKGARTRAAIAWLDSTRLHQRVEGEYESDGTNLKYMGDKWVVY